jgi:shikimate kinase
MNLASAFTERNLILTGYIGPEHTAIGKRLATNLRLPYVNVEQQIAERLNMTVDEIRAYYGETRLKALEAEIISETVLRRGSVIRISGRTLVNGDNYQRIRATGTVFCLMIGLDVMLQRLHISMGARYHDPKDRALALGEIQREWAVHQLDGLHLLDTSRMDDEEIIQTLGVLWRSLTIRGMSNMS